MTTNKPESPNRFISCRPEDRAKFRALCERETRSHSDQFQVILREAYERRGLDFEAGESVSAVSPTQHREQPATEGHVVKGGRDE